MRILNANLFSLRDEFEEIDGETFVEHRQLVQIQPQLPLKRSSLKEIIVGFLSGANLQCFSTLIIYLYFFVGFFAVKQKQNLWNQLEPIGAIPFLTVSFSRTPTKMLWITLDSSTVSRPIDGLGSRGQKIGSLLRLALFSFRALFSQTQPAGATSPDQIRAIQASFGFKRFRFFCSAPSWSTFFSSSYNPVPNLRSLDLPLFANRKLEFLVRIWVNPFGVKAGLETCLKFFFTVGHIL